MSDVSSGAVMTLVIPLALLIVVLAVWGLSLRRTVPEEDEHATPRRDG